MYGNTNLSPNVFVLNMAKPKETFNKKEKEKKRLKQRQDKQQKMEERKSSAKKGKTLEEMMAYIDEDGNISATPPDPRKKKVFNQEDIQITVPKHEAVSEVIRTGVVNFFNESKGFGFIDDSRTGEGIFVHVNNLLEPVKERDKVQFEVEMGARGPGAINVKKIV